MQNLVIFPGLKVVLDDGVECTVGRVDVRALNTQCAEQCNRALDRIRVQSTFMSQSNFLDYTKYFLAMYNRRTVASKWATHLRKLSEGRYTGVASVARREGTSDVGTVN